MNILADASLAGLQAAFPKPFTLTLYHHAEELPRLLERQEVLLCRATLPVNEPLLQQATLKYLATASSGSDHIDKTFLKKQAIKLFDAKGCNASSVADYVLSCIAFLQTRYLIQGSQVGIIGMGAVGSCVYQRLQALNFKINTYALNGAEKEDIILIAGKGHEAYQQIGSETLVFSDQAVVRKWFGNG